MHVRKLEKTLATSEDLQPTCTENDLSLRLCDKRLTVLQELHASSDDIRALSVVKEDLGDVSSSKQNQVLSLRIGKVVALRSIT